MRDRPPYPHRASVAARDSVPAPVLRCGGQGPEWGRGAGRVHALHLFPEAGPEAGSGRVDYHGDLPLAQQHAGYGLEEERAKALSAELLPGGSPQEFCSGMEQIGREETHEEAHFVCGEAVVRDIVAPQLPAPVMLLRPGRAGELERERVLPLTKVLLRSAPLAVALQECHPVHLLGGRICNQEEVVEEEVLLLARPLQNDQHHAPRPAPRAGPVAEFMDPESPLLGRTPRGAAEEGGSEPLECGVAPDARHVADVLGLQGREEVLGRKSGVHSEPELPGEPLQVAERGQDEIQPARGGMRVSFPKAPCQEITLLAPKHGWMVAADPVMAIVGAAGLMPMDLDGERVQIQHEAAWCIPAKSPFGHGEQHRPESRAVLVAREVFQEARERGLGGEPLGSPPRGRAERGVAPSPRDRNAKERIMAQQCGISVLAPPLALEQDLVTEEFQPRVRDAQGARGSRRWRPKRRASPSRSMSERRRSVPASALSRSGRAST